MIFLPGYQLSAQIYQSPNSLVYRGYREWDRKPVVIKVLRHDYPTPTQLTRYKQEYQITHNLDLTGVVKAYSLENYQNTLVIIFEDFGGESLRNLSSKNNFSLEEFLQIAIATTEALDQIHAANIIHQDINPSNIVCNLNTQQLKIIDFGISSHLNSKSPTLNNPDLLKGTLAYISPEQTGRINRALDYRSDLYSLGITFYELLTGELPFVAPDCLSLIYCHLAKQPSSIVNSRIPQIVSDIVLKLMSKNPDERYQTAWRIKADLKKCWQQLKNTGTIKMFPLAEQDISSKFKISQELYGREREVGSLLTVFNRVTGKQRLEDQEESQPELVLVSGYSGIGKSRLVTEVYQSIVNHQGYFIAGKFDQYQRDIPYYAIIQALKSLIAQLLTETKEQLAQWRAKLKVALGVNGQVIVDLIPEIELVIGKQLDLPDLEPKEVQNRFNLVFQNFILVFTQPEHPLVLFLDDLQWVDSASLKLIQLLVNTPDINSLLLIGAYRDREVDATHPLLLAVEEFRKSNIAISEISLSHLKLEDINQLVADTLNISRSHTQSLAELLQAKTNGNPFFLREFFKSLYEEELLWFDFTAHTWKWDLEQISDRRITDNVVELITNKIKKIPTATQEILKLGSCIGNQFDLYTLGIIAEASPSKVTSSLDDAIAQGMIRSLNDIEGSTGLDIIECESVLSTQVRYQFVHDKIQQAVYSLIIEEDRNRLHLQIGRLLLNRTALAQTVTIFEIVNQLNNARQLIINRVELDELAQLNQQAATKAKASGAYQAAFNYFQISLQLLPKDSWINHYARALKIYRLTASAAYLNGDCTQTIALTETILQQANTVLDRVIAYEIRIKACLAKGEIAYGLQFSLEALSLLGLKLPNSPNKVQVLAGLLNTKINLWGKSVEDLAYLPKMETPKVEAAIRIIQVVSTAALMSKPKLYVLMILKRMDWSIKYGHTFESASIYITYAFVLTTILNDIPLGYRYGVLALKVMNLYEPQKQKTPITLMVNTFIFPYKKHLRETLNSYLLAYQNGLEVGDLMNTSSSITFYIIHSYYSGVALPRIEQESSLFYKTMLKLKQQNFISLFRIYHQTCINLISPANTHLLSGELNDELEMLPLNQADNKYAIFNLYLQKSIICYLFQSNAEASINISQAKHNFDPVMGQVFASVLNLYDSLIYLANYSDADYQSQKQIINQVKANQKNMRTWAYYAPMNYLHKYYLVEAEKYRALGKHSLAINLYDRAINLAHKNEYLNEEAIAYELAAKFYLSRKNKLVATAYLKQARFCYLKWGANAKVEHLDDNYSELFSTEVEQSITIKRDSITTSSVTKQEVLDLSTLIKTSQAIAQTTELDYLLETIIRFVLENAGAEKGFLIIIQGEDLTIRASGTTSETIIESKPLESSNNLGKTIINYVYRTKEHLILNNASSEGLFINDNYISNNNIKSVLCLPILNQGKPIAILYLENNLAKNVFTAERLEVLKLISSQAAISIENALLRQHQEVNFEYQVGGCLTIDAPTYVIRQADIDLYKNLQQGNYCYVLNSRHMGKSSLRVRIMAQLQRSGIVCAAIDLTSIGSKNITPEQWYAGVIYSLVNSLKLTDKFDFRNWWRSLDLLSPVQRFSQFIQQVLLKEIEDKIIIFIDEIDSTLGLNFSLDDFFAAIRSCYNSRADDSNYQRLSFVFLGVASPSSLVQDKNCTPFNIGKAIALCGFQLHEVEPLITGLATQHQNPQALIKEVLAWTDGQPFLTQKICNSIVDTQATIPPGKEAEWVENLIHHTIINNWESKDDPQHLKTICDRLFNNPADSTKLLQLYQQILQSDSVAQDDTNYQKQLLLSGLVKQEGVKLKVYNRIYQSVFNSDWCEQKLREINLTKSTNPHY